MAKTQIKLNRLHRLFGWLGRHKITASFALLVLAVVLYFVISGIVLQVQIHSERERFNKAQKNFTEIQDNLKGVSPIQPSQYCYYESSTNEFVVGSRYCVIRLSIINQDLEQSTALQLTQNITHTVSRIERLHKEAKQDNSYLVQEGFTDQGIDCSFSAQYYDSMAPPSARANGAPQSGSALLIDLICSSPAKSNYFPVIND